MSAPEFDGEPMTKRETRIARGAFCMGAWMKSKATFVEANAWRGDDVEAESLYPDPKVTRPRVVKDPNGAGAWGAKPLSHGTLAIHYVANDGTWELPGAAHLITTERVIVWASLLAHPTEEVDA